VNTETGSSHVEPVALDIFALGDGTPGPFNGWLSRPPVVPNTVSITDGTETFTDDGAGNLTGSLGGTGTIDYVSGIVNLTFNGNVTNGVPIRAFYDTTVQDSNANERLYYAYFDRSQSGTEWASTADVVGVGASSARVFRWGFTEVADPVNDEATFPAAGTTVNNVSSFGILSDGFLGQAWWSPDANQFDDGATHTHFLVAVWTEMVAGYATARGVNERFGNIGGARNEVDRKLMTAAFHIEDGIFGSAQEVDPDTQAAENDSALLGWIQSDGDSILNERFITYDNQIFFTYADAAADNDPATAPDYNAFARGEGIDSVMNWNRYQPSTNTTIGAGSFLTNSVRLSPSSTHSHLGVGLGGATNQNLPDMAWELVSEFDNQNGPVVFGADEGLGATYVFFTHIKFAQNLMANPSPPPPVIFNPDPTSSLFLDDKDLFVAQVRHNETVNYFTPSEDLLEIDTLGDIQTVTAEDGTAMNFDSGTDPNDFRLEIGTSNNGPVFDEFSAALLTVGGVGGDTRIVFRLGGAVSGAPAYTTRHPFGAAFPYDEDFSAGLTDQGATVEDNYRSVQDDWRVVLNSSSEFFVILYRQQDPQNQSIGTYGGVVRREAGDVGLWASRLSTTLAGDTPAALAGQALVGSFAERLDSDTSTVNPTAANQYREDAVAFQVQSDMDPRFSIQSDRDRITVVFLTIEDDNPAVHDARNTLTGDHSYDLVHVVQVENGAAALTLRPQTGGIEVARYPFGFFTADDNPFTAENPGIVLEPDQDFYDSVRAVDAGLTGDVVIYYLRPTAPEIQIGGVFTQPNPAGVRLFAANFDGSLTSPLPSTQISTDAGTNYAQAQALLFVTPITRRLSTAAPFGRDHLIMWVEDRGSSSGFLGGGALMTTRYNKALPSASAAKAVTDADAFTPAQTVGPIQADFDAGDSISFPIGNGFGMHQGDVSLYFTQFGEIYYNEYSSSTGKWWVDGVGLPAPTLLSNEGFPGMPNHFLAAITGQHTDMFGAQVFSNYIVQDLTSTAVTPTVDFRRYDNRTKALVFYAKDDGGWDTENDGTGFNRLFCRIRN
jgi:hypothetical protein